MSVNVKRAVLRYKFYVFGNPELYFIQFPRNSIVVLTN